MFNFTDLANRNAGSYNKYDRAFKTAKDLIASFNLHENPAEMVDVGRLFENYDLRFLELPQAIWGFTLLLDDTATTIAINEKLTAEQTRYVAVHEIGHIACAHPNQFHNCLQEQGGLPSPEEFEANCVAAYLLIPHLALATTLLGNADSLSELEIAELSKHYLVPPELIILRQELFKYTAY
jgi:Zn-dependent peptidase ImmA (M78 family)